MLTRCVINVKRDYQTVLAGNVDRMRKLRPNNYSIALGTGPGWPQFR